MIPINFYLKCLSYFKHKQIFINFGCINIEITNHALLAEAVEYAD